MFISVKEAAARWKVSDRVVRRYCTQGRIMGAIRDGKSWLIPDDATKPSAIVPEQPAPKPKLEYSSLAKRILYEKGKNNHFGIYEYIQVNLAYSSNRMASNRLTREQVVDLFRTNKVSVGFEPMKVDDVLETIAHFDCVSLVIENMGAPITEDLIKRLHRVLYYGTYADRKKIVRPGSYRKESDKLGIRPELINCELEALIKWYEKLYPVTLDDILDFHVRFERIRPFPDGNGRVGRLIMMKECLRHGIDPLIIDDKRRSRYNKGIAAWNKDREQLREVCLEAQSNFQAQRELCKLMLYHRPPTGRGTR